MARGVKVEEGHTAEGRAASEGQAMPAEQAQGAGQVEPAGRPRRGAPTPLLIAGGGLLLGLAMGAVILFGIPGGASRTAGPGADAGAQVLGQSPVTGAAAPEFTLLNLAGDPVSLADAQGAPLLINFWATWCGPCRVEMPAIQSRYEAHQEAGLRVYAIDLDEPQALVAEFTQSYALTFDVLLDPGGAVNSAYRVLGYPTSYFVDPEGVIQVVHIGAMSEAQLDEYLTRIMP